MTPQAIAAQIVRRFSGSSRWTWPEIQEAIASALAEAEQQTPVGRRDSDVIAAIRAELWDAFDDLRWRDTDKDRTLLAMVKRLRAERDEAQENRRGEHDLRGAAEQERDVALEQFRALSADLMQRTAERDEIAAEYKKLLTSWDAAHEARVSEVAQLEAQLAALAEQRSTDEEKGSTRMDSLTPIEPPQPGSTDPDVIRVVPPFQHPGYVVRRGKPGPFVDDEVGRLEAGSPALSQQPIAHRFNAWMRDHIEARGYAVPGIYSHDQLRALMYLAFQGASEAPVLPKDLETTQHWAVSVERNGENIVTIESACLSGKSDLSPEDEETIRTAARHLLAFVGATATEDKVGDR